MRSQSSPARWFATSAIPWRSGWPTRRSSPATPQSASPSIEDLSPVPDIAQPVDGGRRRPTHRGGRCGRHRRPLRGCRPHGFGAGGAGVSKNLICPVNRSTPPPGNPRLPRAAPGRQVHAPRQHAARPPDPALAGGNPPPVFRIARERLAGGGARHRRRLRPEERRLSRVTSSASRRPRRPRPARQVGRRALRGALEHNHGRDNHFTVEAALDDGGRIRAIRAIRTINLGAYAAPPRPRHAGGGTGRGLTHLTGVYGVEAAHVTGPLRPQPTRRRPAPTAAPGGRRT